MKLNNRTVNKYGTFFTPAERRYPMITQITIRQPGYGDFTLAELTKNNILLFSSPELKDRVAAEIEKIWLLPEDNDDSVLYSTTSPEEKTVPDGKEQGVRHFLTTTASLSDGQRFVFTVEPAFLYAAKTLSFSSGKRIRANLGIIY